MAADKRDALIEVLQERDLRYQERHDADQKIFAERDRRYAEVASEREKALKIKEEADKNALLLARDIQTYKDEKANELRSQIERERGSYVTKTELISAVKEIDTKIISAVKEIDTKIAPLLNYVSSQQGQTKGVSTIWAFAVGGIGILVGIGTVIIGIIALMLKWNV